MGTPYKILLCLYIMTNTPESNTSDAPENSADFKPCASAHQPAVFEWGERMRLTRIKRGKDLASIAQQLRIRLDYLIAIEDGKLDQLPLGPYTLGWVRSYASYLNMDAQQAVSEYKKFLGENRNKQVQLHFPAPSDTGGIPSGLIILLGIFVLSVIYFIWIHMEGGGKKMPRSDIVAMVNPTHDGNGQSLVSPSPSSLSPTVNTPSNTPQKIPAKPTSVGGQETSPVKQPKSAQKARDLDKAQPKPNVEQQQTKTLDTTKPEPEVTPKSEAIAKPKSQITLESKPEIKSEPQSLKSVTKAKVQPVVNGVDNSLVLKSLGSVWVAVHRDGKAMVEKVLRPGEALDLTPYDGAILHLGNAGLVQLFQGDKISRVLGQYGEVKQNITIGKNLNDYFD